MMILSWYENYTENEIPPQYMWEDGEELSRWFKRVRAKRGLAVDDGDEIPDDDDMSDNEYAAMFKGDR